MGSRGINHVQVVEDRILKIIFANNPKADPYEKEGSIANRRPCGNRTSPIKTSSSLRAGLDSENNSTIDYDGTVNKEHDGYKIVDCFMY